MKTFKPKLWCFNSLLTYNLPGYYFTIVIRLSKLRSPDFILSM